MKISRRLRERRLREQAATICAIAASSNGQYGIWDSAALLGVGDPAAQIAIDAFWQAGPSAYTKDECTFAYAEAECLLRTGEFP